MDTEDTIETRSKEIMDYHDELLSLLNKYKHLGIPGLNTLIGVSNLYVNTESQNFDDIALKLHKIDNYVIETINVNE
jgi:hypothetical protein